MGAASLEKYFFFFFFCITLMKPSFQAWPRPARAHGTDGPFMLAAFSPLAQSGVQNT